MIWFKRVFFVVLFLMLTLWFGGRWILSFSVAQYSGVAEVSKLNENVEITFDEKGIPQIWAKTDRDMYYALGWLHASERLFQGELVRRMAYGELSEIFGDIAYELDVKQRTIGFARRAKKDIQNIDKSYENYIQAYCDGMNEWVKSRTVLPPEFVIIGIEPKEWTVDDIASILNFQTWYAHTLMDRDTTYQFLTKNLGEEIEKALLKRDHWAPSTINTTDQVQNVASTLNMSFASNAWAVSPNKSVSGHAIMASDPHLQVDQVPGFWYLAGLHSEEGTNFIGTTFPGMPTGIMGHNDSIAVAFTVAAVDLVDYYKEKRDPNDSSYVLRQDGHEKMGKITEKIFVRGEDKAREVDILSTKFGVVVESDENELKVMHWAGFDFDISNTMESMFRAYKANNLSEFRSSVTNLGALNVNWMYSDRKGNIAYQLGAPVAKRQYNTYKTLRPYG